MKNFRGRVGQSFLQRLVARLRNQAFVFGTDQKDRLANVGQPAAIVERGQNPGPCGGVTNRRAADVVDKKPPTASVERRKVALMIGFLKRSDKGCAGQSAGNETADMA